MPTIGTKRTKRVQLLCSDPPELSDIKFVFDATLSLRHGDSVTITRHPVETGSSVVDHLVVEPAELTLDVVQTLNSSVETWRLLKTAMSAGLLFRVDAPLLSRRRVEPSFTPELLTPEFAMIGMEVEEDKSTGTILRLRSLRLVEVRKVKSAVGQARRVKLLAKDAEDAKVKNQQSTEEPPKKAPTRFLNFVARVKAVKDLIKTPVAFEEEP